MKTCSSILETFQKHHNTIVRYLFYICSIADDYCMRHVRSCANRSLNDPSFQDFVSDMDPQLLISKYIDLIVKEVEQKLNKNKLIDQLLKWIDNKEDIQPFLQTLLHKLIQRYWKLFTEKMMENWIPAHVCTFAHTVKISPLLLNKLYEELNFGEYANIFRRATDNLEGARYLYVEQVLLLLEKYPIKDAMSGKRIVLPYLHPIMRCEVLEELFNDEIVNKVVTESSTTQTQLGNMYLKLMNHCAKLIEVEQMKSLKEYMALGFIHTQEMFHKRKKINELTKKAEDIMNQVYKHIQR